METGGTETMPARRRGTLPLYLVIVAANLLLLVLSWLSAAVPNLCAMVPSAVWHGQVWRVFTYAWIHAGWGHFLGNMLALAPFALYLEYRYGRAAFAGYYLASCALVGVFLLFTGQAAVGASGAVCAMAMLTVLELLAGQTRSVWILIPELILGAAVVLLWVLPNMWGDLMGVFRNDGISHLGHLGGFLAGFLMFRLRAKPKARRRSAS